MFNLPKRIRTAVKSAVSLATVAAVFGSNPALAWYLVDSIRVNVIVSYTEPTVLADGTPLTDLVVTSLYYPSRPDRGDIAASSSTGGANKNIGLWIFSPSGVATTTSITATATRTSSPPNGMESVQATPVSITVDRRFPQAPSGEALDTFFRLNWTLNTDGFTDGYNVYKCNVTPCTLANGTMILSFGPTVSQSFVLTSFNYPTGSTYYFVSATHSFPGCDRVLSNCQAEVEAPALLYQ